MPDVDVTAKAILDKRYKVVERSKRPNFIPYTDSMGTHSPFTDFIYYQKMPEVYRTFDEPLGKPLYRYLQSLLEGGYADLVYNSTKGERGIENLLDMLDPQTCPAEFLPYYCKSMGIEWFQDLIIERGDIDPYYFIRTFLSNVGEIYKRRGTESVVKYIAKVLTSMDVDLTYQRIFNRYGVTKERVLWIQLLAETPEEIAQVEVNSEVIKRFIDTQIPYYITSRVLYVISKGDIIVSGYTGMALAKVKKQTIIPTASYVADAGDFIYYETEDNEIVLVLYIGSGENRIIVPRKIDGKLVVGLEPTTFSYNDEITYIKLPDTIRFIG